MAALSSRSSSSRSRSRRLVATLAAVVLVLLQAFALSPLRAHAGPGLAAAACGGGEDTPATPSAPCADRCLLYAVSAVVDAPACAVLRVPAPPPLAAPAPAPARLGRAPPGWASSWSSQAPPRVR